MHSHLTRPAALLKAATVAGFAAIGGTSQAASLLGVGISTASKYASNAPEWAANLIRVDLAVMLDREAGHPFITSAMRHLVEEAPCGFAGPLTASAILKLDGVLDDVVREVAAAMDDGHLDAAERQAVRHRIALAQASLARLDSFVAGVA